jgi:hypothetical protein
MKFPNRHANHVSESKSLQLLAASLPSEWILRHWTERDYGVDCLIEPVTNAEVRGDLFAVQVKSQTTLKWPSSSDPSSRRVRFGGISTATVNYWMQLPMPVFLCLVDLQSDEVFFASVKDQVRHRYLDFESNPTFGFDVFYGDRLAAPHGLELFLAEYSRERAFREFASALVSLLSDRDSHMTFIEERLYRDFFMEVDVVDVIALVRLYEQISLVCRYSKSERRLPSLTSVFADDRTSFPGSWAPLHEQSQARLLRELAPAFAEALRLGHLLVTQTEYHFWQATNPLLVRYLGLGTAPGWLDDIDRRVAACI